MEKRPPKCISTITDRSPQLFISKSEAGAEATKTFFFSSPMIHDRYKQDEDDLNLFNWSDCNELRLDLSPLCCSEVTHTSDVRKPSYWKGLCEWQTSESGRRPELRGATFILLFLSQKARFGLGPQPIKTFQTAIQEQKGISKSA